MRADGAAKKDCNAWMQKRALAKGYFYSLIDSAETVSSLPNFTEFSSIGRKAPVLFYFSPFQITFGILKFFHVFSLILPLIFNYFF